MRELVVAVRRADDDAQRARALAWYVAALSRRDKLPELGEWLRPAPAPRAGGPKQTRAQQRAVFEQLSAQLGIPLQRTRLVATRGGDPDGGR
jgi:hypothetical protein